MKKNYMQTNGIIDAIRLALSIRTRGLWIGFFSLLLFIAPLLKAQDCGTGDTLTLDVNTNINGLLVIEPGDVLQIMPGVIVTFETAQSKIIVNGTILATGTAANPVVFTGMLPEGWSGIDIIDACPSQFMYCNFSGINRGGAKRYETRAVSGIDISGTDDVLFEFCTFTGNNDGIGITGSDGVTISSCNFSDNEILPGQKGLIYIDGGSSDTIRNCEFRNNKTNIRGIISATGGSTTIIQNNQFVQTRFFEPVFNGAIFSVINLRQSDTPNHLIVNSNEFHNSKAPEDNRLCEISVFGNQNNIDNSNVLIWNNTFIGYPFPTPDQTPKTAIRANYSVLTISHNTIRFYNHTGIELLVSEAKINLNTLASNITTAGVVYFDEYNGYSGREINNVIYANTFTNNRSTNGAAILSNILPNQNIITTISQNIFTGNKAIGGNGGAICDLYGSQLKIESNVFTQNTADAGGAICIESINGNELFTTIIKDNTFTQNISSGFGGAIFASKSLINIENNIVRENEAQVGAGLFLNGNNSASKKAVRSSTSIVDNLFEGNIYSQAGGGCYLLECGDVEFVRNLVSANGTSGAPSTEIGGGLYAVDCNLEIYNSHFIANEAGTDLGSVFLSMNPQNSLVFQNCNVTANSDAGGLVFSSSVTPGNIDIYNSLFYENNQGATGKAIIYNGPESITANNCFFDVLPSTYDVSFAGELVGNEPGWTGPGDYYLDCANSVCVDSGNADPVYNDLPGANPDEAMFPSCGNLTNDIGISGGPFAKDIPDLFQPGNILENAGRHHEPQLAPYKSWVSVTDPDSDQFSVYPNPSNGHFSVSFNDFKFEKATLTVTNAAGQIIHEIEVSGMESIMQFDLTDANKGVYFIRVHTDQKVITKKVILN
jgi:parallel beta-helix repeat protein/predicted outer membrane repeat protein